MEFSNRNLRPTERPSVPAQGGTAIAVETTKSRPSIKQQLQVMRGGRWTQLLFMVLLISSTLLVVALIVQTATSRGETAYINKGGYQVVSLADKQVFFGKITSMNDSFISLTDVFYLNQADSATANSSTQLIKRGGEVHCPYDRMTISRAQVNFWENIQADGQIGKLIAQWHEKNQGAQTCGSGTSDAPQQGQPTTPVTPTTPSETEQTSTNESETTETPATDGAQ